MWGTGYCLQDHDYCSMCGTVWDNQFPDLGLHECELGWVCAQCCDKTMAAYEQYQVDNEPNHMSYEDWIRIMAYERVIVLDLDDSLVEILTREAEALGLTMERFLVKLLTETAERILREGR